MKRPQTSLRRGGFTLLETAISSLLVGILLVASMQTVGTVFRQRSLSADKMAAQLLADQLLADLLEFPYQDTEGTPAFGPESGETGNRTLFDDVDDFHNYSESPPKYRDGTSMSEWTGWSRQVAVENVAVNDALLTGTLTVSGTPVGVGLTSGGASGTGLRRVTVTVRRNGTAIATAQGIRSASWK